LLNIREEGKKSRERNGRNRSGAITGNGEGEDGGEKERKSPYMAWRSG